MANILSWIYVLSIYCPNLNWPSRFSVLANLHLTPKLCYNYWSPCTSLLVNGECKNHVCGFFFIWWEHIPSTWRVMRPSISLDISSFSSLWISKPTHSYDSHLAGEYWVRRWLTLLWLELWGRAQRPMSRLLTSMCFFHNFK